MPIRSFRRFALVTASLTLVAGAAGCAQAAKPRTALGSTAGYSPASAARSACAVRGASRRADAVLRRAVHRYRDEAGGAVIHTDLRRIAHDQRLLHALASNDLAAAQAAAASELANHHHVVQLRVLRGQRVVVDANPGSFDVAGSSRPLAGPHGGRLGTLQITIQDVVGFIKLMRRHDGAAATVVRGASGHVETDLPAADHRTFPPRGCVTVAGAPYLVRSFQTANFTGEALTVWVFVRP
jgi:hypothetical protein